MTEENDMREPMDQMSHDLERSAGPVRGRKLPRRQMLLGLVGLTAAGAGLAYWLSSRPASEPSQPLLKATPTPQPKLLHTYQGNTQADTVFGIAWSADDTRLAGAGKGVVRVWNAADGRLVSTLGANTSGVEVLYSGVSWSADGKRLASVSSYPRAVQVWDSTDGRLLSTVSLDTIPSSTSWVVLSPDGKQLASYERNGLLRVWDATDGHLIFTLQEDMSSSFDVAWSADGDGGSSQHLILVAKSTAPFQAACCISRLNGEMRVGSGTSPRSQLVS